MTKPHFPPRRYGHEDGLAAVCGYDAIIVGGDVAPAPSPQIVHAEPERRLVEFLLCHGCGGLVLVGNGHG